MTDNRIPLGIGDDDIVGACVLLPRRMRHWLRIQAAALTDQERRRVTQSEVVRRLIEADAVYAAWLVQQQREAKR